MRVSVRVEVYKTSLTSKLAYFIFKEFVQVIAYIKISIELTQQINKFKN